MATKHTQQSFIEMATSKHNSFYCYKDVVYESSSKKVTINCPIHGPFQQRAGNHLRGDGCKSCNASGGRGVYSFNYFERWPEEKDKQAILYVMRMSYLQTQWVKVGITVSTVTDRFSKQIYKGMDITCIKQVSLPLFDAFKTEQQIITDLKDYKFTHDIKFCGHTECFYDIPIVHSYVEGLQIC